MVSYGEEQLERVVAELKAWQNHAPREPRNAKKKL